jgi:chromosome segregation ATPase
MIEQLDKTYEQLKKLRNKANTQEEFEKIRSQMDKINLQRQSAIGVSINEANQDYKAATAELKKAQPLIESAIKDLNKITDAIKTVSKVISQIEKVLVKV